MKKEKILKDLNQNIDQLIREKMDAFEVAPPAHVWEGVLSGLDAHYAVKKANTAKKIFAWAAAALLLGLLGWLLLSPANGIWAESQLLQKNSLAFDNQNDHMVTLAIAEESKEEEKSSSTTVGVNIAPTVNQVEGMTVYHDETVEITKQAINDISDPLQIEMPEFTYNETVLVDVVENKIEQSRSIYSISFLSFEQITQLNLFYDKRIKLYASKGQSPTSARDADGIDKPVSKKSSNQHPWSVFAGLTSEFVSTSFDSVTILNSYSIGFEPVYHLNKQWFIRSGIGVSSSRDRGFARLDYISNDYMGSYDDVFDVTFDSIGDQVVPTYHTKTVEVWDSIRHLVVSEITNRYAYIQVPLMFGYLHSGANSSFNWYMNAGPIFNFQVGRWIDEPNPAESYIEILNLQNKLPERNNFYLQLSVSAGIDYKITDNLSMAVEPGYRYYVNSIFSKEGYNRPISAFSLRLGAKFRIK